MMGEIKSNVREKLLDLFYGIYRKDTQVGSEWAQTLWLMQGWSPTLCNTSTLCSRSDCVCRFHACVVEVSQWQATNHACTPDAVLP
jgi:hypothetical protein